MKNVFYFSVIAACVAFLSRSCEKEAETTIPERIPDIHTLTVEFPERTEDINSKVSIATTGYVYFPLAGYRTQDAGQFDYAGDRALIWQATVGGPILGNAYTLTAVLWDIEATVRAVAAMSVV